MTAHEDHPELVVPDPVLGELLVDGERQRPLAVEVLRQVGGEGPAGPLAPDGVDGAAAGGGQEPRGRIIRHALEAPVPHRRDERFLNHVFGQFQIVGPEDAREHGDESPRLAPEERLDRGWRHVGHNVVSSPA
jgi:hypothetical protein